MRILTLSVILLALASCGEAPDRQASSPKSVAPETGAVAQVAALKEDQRNGVFAKAIRASGAATCLDVTSSERATVMNGAPGWKAECDDGSAHLIEILSDGTAKVTSRSH